MMDRDQILSCCHSHGQSKPRSSRPRHLHGSTLHLGGTSSCYTTTHAHGFSGRSADGRPLVFRLRDPSFPSQRQSQLDLSDGSEAPRRALMSHTHEVHGPKHIAPRAEPEMTNWARYRSGQAVRELTNPQDPTEYQTTSKAEHTVLVPDSWSPEAGSRPTQCHQHDILTGEQKKSVGEAKNWRRTRNAVLWAARRWETDCRALRLY